VVLTVEPAAVDGADCFVSEDAPSGHLWHVAFEDVQAAAADGRGVDAHDGVGVGE
jgi:hypothetical protein